MATRLIKPTIRPSYKNKEEYIASLMTPNRKQFPLKRVSVESVVLGGIVSSVVVQEFKNDQKKDALEVVYTFPLSANSSIVRFEATIGNQTTKSVVYEKAYAEAKFEQAREDGHFASIMTQERDHIYTITLTRVPAKTDVKIEIQMIEILTPVSGEYQYRFPTVIPPYFMPGQAVSHQGDGTHPDTSIVTDASRISPPIHLSNRVPFHFNIKLIGHATGIKSSMHLLAEEKSENHTVLTPNVEQQPSLDGDLVVYYRYDQVKQVKAFYQDEFALIQIPTQDLLSQQKARRLMILMDISGSMSGSKLNALKEASISLLKTLSSGDLFQLAVFDDRCTLAFKNFLTYDNTNLTKAEEWIKQQDTRGGTDIHEALSVAIGAFQKTNHDHLFEDLILLVTDGESGDEENIVKLAKNNQVQIFTLGIDSAVNDSLLQKVARYSRALCELCTPNEDLEHIVNRLSPSMYAPLLSNLKVKLSTLDGYGLEQNLLRNQSAMILIKNKQKWTHQSLMDLKVVGTHYEYEKSLKIEDTQDLGELSELNLKSNLMRILPYAWAKDQLKCIKEMMDDHAYRAQHAELMAKQLLLSKEYQLICPQTALFLEIEEVKADGELLKVVQPVERSKYSIYADDDDDSDYILKHSVMNSMIGTTVFNAFSPNIAQFSNVARPRMPRSPNKPKALQMQKAPQQKYADHFNVAFSMMPPSAPSALVNTLANVASRGGSFGSSSADYAKNIALMINADGAIPNADLLEQLVAVSILMILGHTRNSGDRSQLLTKICVYLQSKESQYQSNPHFSTYQWLMQSLEALENLSMDEDSFKTELRNRINVDQIQHPLLQSFYSKAIEL